MPYRWTVQTPTARRLELWPHRSLPRRGFAAFILGTFTLITIPLYPLLGTFVLWGILPFMLLAVGGIWWALERSYRDGEILEVLTLDPETIHLSRSAHKVAQKEWQANSYWVRAEMHQTGGPVPYYVTLKGNGRTVEIGAFLSEEERRSLYGELASALSETRAAHGPDG
ncbi:DUF2244 domain-containing protein [Lutimaribacter sp. EGI FJ00015]|uniref:DUF2244 domain-containing protein n=1 Tax=Lutimaribacter degradans TaxID=2945989 RepID=A0ACC5ZX63_9RHOB|nr:DUF2244 domain-containing protein [Lutimaribacter sp. EGI FJ00013]MCM2562356.1 DUF2244 domain-containing protein [Lutimaribacter sp. EGI FJ00013]MCO0613511.1 DUF2244 domain-containing protein [Lutimaribacter sp. EGI FJ00015]MCO0636485.1 DUF2244 domain-containing protein [Lutimaribacter sp. EGI FJ00014]